MFPANAKCCDIHLRPRRIRNVNPVLSKSLQVFPSRGHIYVDPKSITVVGKFVDDESVLVEDVNLPGDVVVSLGEVPHEGDLHLSPVHGKTEGQQNCLTGDRKMKTEPWLRELTRSCLYMLTVTALGLTLLYLQHTWQGAARQRLGPSQHQPYHLYEQQSSPWWVVSGASCRYSYQQGCHLTLLTGLLISQAEWTESISWWSSI